MNYKQYYIETESACNTGLDHTEDVCCKVYKQNPDTPHQNVQIGHFTITSNEIGDYGSLDKAIIAYMHRDYPDNNPADEERYSMIRKQEKQLRTKSPAD